MLKWTAMINTGPEKRTLIQCFGGTKGAANLFCIVPPRTWCLTETIIIHNKREITLSTAKIQILLNTLTLKTHVQNKLYGELFFHFTSPKKKNFFSDLPPVQTMRLLSMLTARLRAWRVAKISWGKTRKEFSSLEIKFYSRQKLLSCVRNGTRDRRNVV